MKLKLEKKSLQHSSTSESARFLKNTCKIFALFSKYRLSYSLSHTDVNKIFLRSRQSHIFDKVGSFLKNNLNVLKSRLHLRRTVFLWLVVFSDSFLLLFWGKRVGNFIKNRSKLEILFNLSYGLRQNMTMDYTDRT